MSESLTFKASNTVSSSREEHDLRTEAHTVQDGMGEGNLVVGRLKLILLASEFWKFFATSLNDLKHNWILIILYDIV